MSPRDPFSPPSLRIFSEKLAPLLGTTPDTLYERQRSLVRERLLRLEGRGRGGGTKATPRNIALLVIAFMASDSPIDAGKRAKRLAKATPDGDCDPFSACTSFLDTLINLVDGLSDHRKYPTRVSVSRSAAHATIEWPRADGSSFGGIPVVYSADDNRKPNGVSLEATIDGGVFLVIGRELWMMQRKIKR